MAASIVPTTTPTTPTTPEPIPWEGLHVATGLALVVFPDDGTPAGQIFVADPAGNLRQLTGSGPASSRGASLPVWSPDRSRVAFGPPKVGMGAGRFLSVIDADGSGERALAELGDEFGFPFEWSPDGGRLLYFDIDAVDGPAMWLVDVVSGEVTHLGVGQGPRWLPDGRRISFQRSVQGRDQADPEALTQVMYVMEVESGEVTELAEATDAIWSPDGTAVLLQLETGELALADANGSDRSELVRGWAPVWSPDGSQIAFAYDHDSDGVPLLAVVDRRGHPIWSGLAGGSPAWSTDGSRLAVEVSVPHPTVKVLDVRTGEVLWQTAGAQPAWGP